MQAEKKTRYHFLDGIRGIVLVSMILYHGAWNMVYLYGANWPWYHSKAAYIWQQSICYTFILLSGFCWSLGKNHFKRGILVFASGALVTGVTLALMPEQRVVFGILTCIGSCMLLMIGCDKVLAKWQASTILILSGILFFLTRGINDGYIGFENLHLLLLPKGLYCNAITTYFGFPHRSFFSTDYFSVFPWFFLFVFGYGAYQLLAQKNVLKNKIWKRKIPFFDCLGKHSLLIYLLHQPIMYLIMEIWNELGLI